jgi:hypothetical protein
MQMFNRRSSSSVVLAVVVAAVLAGAVGGCSPWRPSGPVGSQDEYTYYSTPHQPQTVTLLDTRSGEKLWSVEIPVGQQLSMRFSNEYNQEAKGQDVMRWKLFPQGQKFGRLDNRMAVPPASSRRLDVTLRPGPEYATAPVGDADLGGGPNTTYSTTQDFSTGKK